MPSDDDMLRALIKHDEAVGSRGRSIWIGAEATYTDRSSEAPEWLFDALGGDKTSRAERLLARHARAQPGAAVLRSVGRQYGGEPVPRWSLGLYARRDGTAIWHGPPDPLLAELRSPPNPDAFAGALAAVLEVAGLNASTLPAPLSNRVVFRTDGKPPRTSIEDEPSLARPSLHGEPVEGAEVVDCLAEAGNYLVACLSEDGDLRVELPGIQQVALFQRLLDAVSSAALEIQTPALVLAGFPPPVDETVSWMTVTPDPAVIEVNMAPAPDAADLLHRLRLVNRLAAAEGLDSFRLQYNGVESDSGGGGHITLGGCRPTASPFLTVPSLLPNLIRYFNRHPSLSYRHASESVGPASQAPRADECLRESFLELSLTLEHLKRVESITPDLLWTALTPFLSDPSGNPHRSEINIEKLWNPALGARGRQGLVEFRAFRMAATPEMTAALAALLRAVAVMLAEQPLLEPLVDWGDALHQRFSLPFYLVRDLNEVFADLEHAGLDLAPPLRNRLLDDGDLRFNAWEVGGCRVEIRRAVEFWPLVGDVATQERGSSRLIDSSSSRIEVRLRAAGGDSSDLGDWTLAAAGWRAPLREDHDAAGCALIAGVRYRGFVPRQGLHPTLAAQSPLTLMLMNPAHGSWRITLHDWRPDNEPYPRLPVDVHDARQRRAERCVMERLSESAPAPAQPPPAAVGEHVLDLRWM